MTTTFGEFRNRRIDISNVDLVKFVQKVYELSIPVGFGILHYTPQPLSEQEAKTMINLSGPTAVNMDYVKGRGCKMVVRREEDGKLSIANTWYDHTNTQLKELLKFCGVESPKPSDHSISCNCEDCQYPKPQPPLAMPLFED